MQPPLFPPCRKRAALPVDQSFSTMCSTHSIAVKYSACAPECRTSFNKAGRDGVSNRLHCVLDFLRNFDRLLKTLDTMRTRKSRVTASIGDILLEELKECKFASSRTAATRSPRNGALVSWVQGLKHNLASDAIVPDLLLHVLVVRLEGHVARQVIILVRHLRVAHIGHGMRRGALYECMLIAVSSVRARPGPHYWGSSWEGLTQTRPAPGGFGSPRVGKDTELRRCGPCSLRGRAIAGRKETPPLPPPHTGKTGQLETWWRHRLMRAAR